MILKAKFAENSKKIKASFGEVHNISDGGFERGYAEGEAKGYKNGYTEGEIKGKEQGYTEGYDDGYTTGSMAGKTDISTLPNFNGVATENAGEYYYDFIARNSIWIPANLIPFDGEIGTTYLIKAAIKCGTCDRVGVAFAYEDGTLVFGTRDTNTDYRVYVAVSDPSKRLAHIALSYGSNGSCYVKDFTIEAVLKE